jgi:hypothetical protein
MSIEKLAIDFAQKDFKKNYRHVEDVSKKTDHRGYDFTAKNGKKSLKIEVKGCGHPWGIPDLYFTEVTKPRSACRTHG